MPSLPAEMFSPTMIDDDNPGVFPLQAEGLEGLELSTQLLILEARRRGVAAEILDRSENFIRLERDRQVEYVKQATRTSRDNYIAPLIMENKLVTKLLLERADINVPDGRGFHTPESAFSAYADLKPGRQVIKPNTTNFGKGITILRDSFSRSEYESALKFAFIFDRTVLVENFIPGQEYRFLVIGEEVAGILQRVPANVTGDAIHSIEQLVDLKNRNPIRGEGYQRPLEKIHLGDEEQHYLQSQGLNFQSIPLLGEPVFLRENSNISTGGDSIDFTDDISFEFKEIAIKAVKAVGAAISGVDMIIGDLSCSPDRYNYSIIELNFNPALHIHDFPFSGKNRQVEKKVLNLLGF